MHKSQVTIAKTQLPALELTSIDLDFHKYQYQYINHELVLQTEFLFLNTHMGGCCWLPYQDIENSSDPETTTLIPPRNEIIAIPPVTPNGSTT